MMQTDVEIAQTTFQFPPEIRRFALPLLLITFPFAIALAAHPTACAIVFAAFCCLAYQLKCLKAFTVILFISLLVNACVFSGVAVYGDVDAYIAPQIRLLAASVKIEPDGAFSTTHLALPCGFTAWCAALYRITGSIDCGAMLIWMLLPAAWLVLRSELSRLQTVSLILSPAMFPSLFNLMSDGCVYLLLLIALVALKERTLFWVPLLSAAGAALCKTSAWIPCLFVGMLLLRYHPKNWWKLALVAVVIFLCSIPTLKMVWAGGVSEISADFECADETAKAMGYWARLAYVYIGHWTMHGEPQFGAHLGGVDGGGVDGLGPLFRVAVVASLISLVLFRKRFRTWAFPLLLAWGSILVMPTLYIGYARYVPWLYPAVMLPLTLLLPRISMVWSSLLCVLPALWMGWRIAISTELVRVASHATAVQSDVYNVRCLFRNRLTDAPQPVLSGSLVYSYQMSEEYFPPIRRTLFHNLKSTSSFAKAADVRKTMLTEWFPWFVCHFQDYLIDLAQLRSHWFITPRGVNDHFSATDR